MENNKVGKEEMNKLPYIIAIDFDGTLVSDKFPEIGEKNEPLFADALRWKALGYKLVLWTCRDNDTSDRNLQAAVEYCRSQGLEFDAVNSNITEVIEMFKNNTRKVYANVYIDDKNIRPSVPQMVRNYDPKKEFKPWRLSLKL